MLDTIPAEIIAIIAFYACTDGGLTGCSLARVSHHIRRTTRVARFHTVTLTEDPPQIEDFLACYWSEVSRAPDSRPPVRHLFLSLFSRQASTAFQSERTQREMQAAPSAKHQGLVQYAAFQRFLRDHEDCNAQYARVLPELLRAVAPDLQTLALLQSYLRKLPTVIVEFPALEELILLGGDPKFHRFDKLEASQPPLYPSLRRLHHILHSQERREVNGGVNFEPWSRHAPNLTHLRVSRIDAVPPVTIDTLIRACGNVPDDEVLFPHLETVLIQPIAPPSGHSLQPSTAEGYAAMMQRLNTMIARTGVSTTILEHWVDWYVTEPQGFFDQLSREIQDEWDDRILGGAGCWSGRLPNSVETWPRE